MCSLCPIITPGTPGTETPQTRKSPVLKCVMCQIEGEVGGKCGSLASMGFRETVRAPLTTQLLLPTCPSPPVAARDFRVAFKNSVKIEISSSLNFVRSRWPDRLVDLLLWGVSVPSGVTSSGEISGSNAAYFSNGKSLIKARSISAKSFPRARESTADQLFG